MYLLGAAGISRKRREGRFPGPAEVAMVRGSVGKIKGIRQAIASGPAKQVASPSKFTPSMLTVLLFQ